MSGLDRARPAVTGELNNGAGPRAGEYGQRFVIGQIQFSVECRLIMAIIGGIRFEVWHRKQSVARSYNLGDEVGAAVPVAAQWIRRRPEEGVRHLDFFSRGFGGEGGRECCDSEKGEETNEGFHWGKVRR